MLPERVDYMIVHYNEHAARCAHLDCAIKEAERLLKMLNDSAVEDTNHITQTFSDMPHGSGVTDPTGRLGIMFADGYKPEHIRELEKNLAEMRHELSQKAITVIFVNAWILALDQKERFVMENKVIGGLSWRQLTLSFKQRFGDQYSVEGMKRLKRAAMEKIYRIAG